MNKRPAYFPGSDLVGQSRSATELNRSARGPINPSGRGGHTALLIFRAPEWNKHPPRRPSPDVHNLGERRAAAFVGRFCVLIRSSSAQSDSWPVSCGELAFSRFLSSTEPLKSKIDRSATLRTLGTRRLALLFQEFLKAESHVESRCFSACEPIRNKLRR